MNDDERTANNQLQYDYTAELRKLSRDLTRIYNQNMPKITIEKYTGNAKHELIMKIRATQIAVLEALNDLSWCEEAKKGRKPEGVSQIELANHLNVDTATMCRNMKVLIEENRWAQEINYTGRLKLLSINDTGRQVLQKAQKAMADMVSNITPEMQRDYEEKLEALKESLNKIKQALKLSK
ncbi:hypothetical protein IJT93_01490 [bacterium]|nr:hypothetical protein [bacterium]